MPELSVCSWCVARVIVVHVATLTFCAAQNEKCMTNGPKTANGDVELRNQSCRCPARKANKNAQIFHSHTHKLIYSYTLSVDN